LPSDIIAAYLYAQLESLDKINHKRINIWNFYSQLFKKYADSGKVKLVKISDDCKFNAHLFYVLFNDKKTRSEFIDFLKKNNISSIFHYIPLHSSPAGIKHGRVDGDLIITDKVSDTIARMPLYYDLEDGQLDYIAGKVDEFFNK
jgi:dTDP-4-amino-4,6-dideoxygalactose transaminase